MEYLVNYGYLGLFLTSFLAATILPFSSEVVLGYLLLNGYNPGLVVTIATLGNVLGSCTNYAIGYWGSVLLVRKVLKISQDEFNKAKRRYNKYGVFSLLFAWVPVFGDPLTVVAGGLKINILVFIILVTIGKLVRYVIVSYMVLL